MNNIVHIEAHRRRRDEKKTGGFKDHFGVCPTCKDDDGHINVGWNHFFVCHEHKCYWHVGSNLFSAWKDENEATWRKNGALLMGYDEVKPSKPKEVRW